MLRMLFDQRGEVGDDDPVDDLEIEDIDDDDYEDEEIIEINPDELEQEDDPEEEDPEPPENEDLVKAREENETLKKALEKRDEEIKKANRNFYGLRKKFESYEAKAKADKDTKFTDDQIKGLLAQHQDDPDMLFQIFRTMSRQEAGNEAKIQIDAANMAQRRKEMDDCLISNWPNVYDEGSEDHQSIQDAKEYFYLKDHPLGDFLAGAATSLMQMDETLENTKKEAREAALKIENNRKKKIKETSLKTGKKPSKKAALSGDQLAIPKQLGLSKNATKIYNEMMKNSNQSATVEV